MTRCPQTSTLKSTSCLTRSPRSNSKQTAGLTTWCCQLPSISSSSKTQSMKIGFNLSFKKPTTPSNRFLSRSTTPSSETSLISTLIFSKVLASILYENRNFYFAYYTYGDYFFLLMVLVKSSEMILLAKECNRGKKSLLDMFINTMVFISSK